MVRYGGEEFVVVLPGTDLEGALIVAENIRRGFAELEINQGGISAHLTVSIGVASTIPDHRHYDEILPRAADDMLYQAKKNGRNRVEATPPPAPDAVLKPIA